MSKAPAILAALLTIASVLPCRAGELPYGLDAYAGALGGYGGSEMWKVDDPSLDSREYPSVKRSSFSAFYGTYAGVGRGVVALEAGWLKLPGYHADVVGAAPPREAAQIIDGSALFARLLLRAPRDWVVQPYLFAGAAHVRAQSHESGVCPTCGVGYVSDFRVSMNATRPYVGAGLELPLWGPLSTRAEFGYIPRASSSFWSGTRDYYLGSVAVQLRF